MACMNFWYVIYVCVYGRRVWICVKEATVWCSVWPHSIRAPAAVKLPFTCGTTTTKSSSQTSMGPSPSESLWSIAGIKLLSVTLGWQLFIFLSVSGQMLWGTFYHSWGRTGLITASPNYITKYISKRHALMYNFPTTLVVHYKYMCNF